MRITRNLLHKIVQDTVSERTRSDRNVLCAYLIGSLLEEEPLMGETTDIDLVFVYNDAPPLEREIKRLSEQVHLDILHHSRSLYRQPRRFRQDPWLGPAIFNCQVLYDPQHFMDFTQASVRGQFDSAENTIERAVKLARQAREGWANLEANPPKSRPLAVANYLEVIANAVNAIACLSIGPLSERRFLLKFPERAQAVDQPGLSTAVMGLLGALNISGNKELLQTWLQAWEAAYKDASVLPEAPPHLHPHRRHYYLQAMNSILNGEQALALLWPLLRTWTDAICTLSASAADALESHLKPWLACCQALTLIDDAFIAERLDALDTYLDKVEEVVEKWGAERGIEVIISG